MNIRWGKTAGCQEHPFYFSLDSIWAMKKCWYLFSLRNGSGLDTQFYHFFLLMCGRFHATWGCCLLGNQDCLEIKKKPCGVSVNSCFRWKFILCRTWFDLGEKLCSFSYLLFFTVWLYLKFCIPCLESQPRDRWVKAFLQCFISAIFCGLWLVKLKAIRRLYKLHSLSVSRLRLFSLIVTKSTFFL